MKRGRLYGAIALSAVVFASVIAVVGEQRADSRGGRGKDANASSGWRGGIEMLAQGRSSASSQSKQEVELPVCGFGRVWLGNDAALIKFEVECRARHRAGLSLPARFQIERQNLESPRADSDIVDISLAPKVISTGKRGRGVCELQAGVASCEWHEKGRFNVRGTFTVPTGDRCARDTDLTVVRPPVCRDGFCEAVLNVDYLAKGRPIGCSSPR